MMPLLSRKCTSYYPSECPLGSEQRFPTLWSRPQMGSRRKKIRVAVRGLGAHGVAVRPELVLFSKKRDKHLYEQSRVCKSEILGARIGAEQSPNERKLFVGTKIVEV